LFWAARYAGYNREEETRDEVRLVAGFLIWLIATLVVAVTIPARGQQRTVSVLIQTQLGDMQVEVDTLKAPLTARNFLRYVDAGFYNGGQFHRTVKLDNQPHSKILIEVIQAGINPENEQRSFPPLGLERTNVTGLLHKNGTISMARGEPNTATSDFFICIGDQPSLDFGGRRNPDRQGFAAFGQVTNGLEVAGKIQASPAEGQKLMPPIKIHAAFRVAAK
jgi:peptidyl-prolyl cis-trans isomerase A (cyclophilin A)